MLKTIYSRIIFVSIVVMFVLMTVTGTVLMGVLGDFFIKDKGMALEGEAARINDLTSFYLSNRTPKVEMLYDKSINDTAAKINGVIFIIDNFGNTITSENAENHFGGKKPDKSHAGSVLSGNKLTEVGNMGGLFAGTYLTVGLPLEVDKKVVGATFLSVPVPVVNEYKYYFFNTFLITIGATFLLVMVLMYFYSKKISRPIREMNKASKEIAKGNFDVKIKADGNTDIAQLAENFNKMTRSLKALEDMRTSFISNVSHELRTPMTTMSGFLEGILDGTIGEEDKEKYLKIVLDETKRLARLVTKLLTLSRIESGTGKLNLKRFDINELIRITVIRFEKQITDKRLDVSIDFEHDSEFVLADKDAISQVMTNLIDNAIKFNIENGYIKIRVESDFDYKINIVVENSGIGIDEEEIEHIFERFYKSDKSRSYDKNGMGLGLYMVSGIIANHGEKIKAESEKDKWARFSFTLKKS